jgi:hypothetical protein
MYLRPGEPVHGVGADFEGKLPAIQHLVKAEKRQLIDYDTCHHIQLHLGKKQITCC